MIFESEKFSEIKVTHLKELLPFLLENAEEFNITCNLQNVEFNPELPPHIKNSFQNIILFVIAGYTKQSAHLDDKNLYFEAGFGEENFGSVVKVPLENIIQILIDETPAFINVGATLPKKPKNPFALNPRNRKILGADK